MTPAACPLALADGVGRGRAGERRPVGGRQRGEQCGARGVDGAPTDRRMRPPLLAAALLALAACADAPDDAAEPAAPVAQTPSQPDRAAADIGEVDGSGVSGRVEFTDLGDAVEIRYNLAGLPGGEHGLHVHQRGDCGPDSTGTPAGAAGDHFNPLSSPHGAPDSSAARRHAGDLGNVAVEGGQAVGVRVDSVLAFDGPTSVVGKAVIVHAGADDFVSQPGGDAGARAGCGVVRRIEVAPDPS